METKHELNPEALHFNFLIFTTAMGLMEKHHQQNIPS